MYNSESNPPQEQQPSLTTLLLASSDALKHSLVLLDTKQQNVL
jgi:hypothetical protein